MKKYVNGKYVEMTAAELDTIREQTKQYEEQLAAQPPTAEERIEALEAALIELVEVVCNG